MHKAPYATVSGRLALALHEPQSVLQAVAKTDRLMAVINTAGAPRTAASRRDAKRGVSVVLPNVFAASRFIRL